MLGRGELGVDDWVGGGAPQYRGDFSRAVGRYGSIRGAVHEQQGRRIRSGEIGGRATRV